MIFVFRRPGSEGATDLAEALDGRRVRFYDNGVFKRLADGSRRYPITAADLVVCWGEGLTPPPGVRVLNGAPVRNKFDDAILLKGAGVPTIEAVRVKPVQAPAGPDPAIALFDEALEAANTFTALPFNRGRVYQDGVADLVARFSRFNIALGVPPPTPAPSSEWLGRSYRHVGGADLLAPPQAPDYFSKKEDIVEEFRIHSFLGKSIKAGVKVPRDGATPHAWIRSLDGGWRIRYDGFESRKDMREVAHAAVKALSLDFGAVDLGRKADGSMIVLEVNRAPGLGDGTINTYSKAIRAWRDGTNTAEEGRA